jgi:hypothetical protein
VDSQGECKEGGRHRGCFDQGRSGLICYGQTGHEQDERSGEKAGLTLLVACVSICEAGFPFCALLLVFFLEKRGEKAPNRAIAQNRQTGQGRYYRGLLVLHHYFFKV